MAIKIGYRDHYPSQNKQYIIDFPVLSGGLNTKELPYRLSNNESPEMRNLWWKEGILQSRPGQTYLKSNAKRGTGYTCYDGLFWGNAFYHIGNKIYYGTTEGYTTSDIDVSITGTGATDYDTGHSDSVNVLNHLKRVTMSTNSSVTCNHVGDGNTRVFSIASVWPDDILASDYSIDSVESVTVDGVSLEENKYYLTVDKKKVRIVDIPAASSTIAIVMNVAKGLTIITKTVNHVGDGETEYFDITSALPVDTTYTINTVTSVTLDGVSTTFTYDKSRKRVELETAPGIDVAIVITAVLTTTVVETRYTYNSTTGHIVFENAVTSSQVFILLIKEEKDNLSSFNFSIPSNRGTFFRYSDYLFYKNDGCFVRIAYSNNSFTLTDVTSEAFVPVTVINASPATGSGDLYQPENRIQAKKTLKYNADGTTRVYRLPVKPVDSVVKVVVDEAEKTVGTDYTVDLTNGTVTFTTAPPAHTPAVNNTVVITYSKSNAPAMNSVLGCKYAISAGGNDNLCILLGGCPAQPNAVFWNSNDNLSMNYSYWPMEYYNLVGDTEDQVTGFGQQYKQLIVFKTRSIGILNYNVETINERDNISFTYLNINSKTGCDLPWSIQLIENNLVFCNTQQGVHFIASSSAAYENNIIDISNKVNGGDYSGLLHDVRQGGVVCSMDDDKRYILCANNHVYCWDYKVSDYSDPSWFYFTNISPVAFFKDDEHELYHINSSGRVTKFVDIYNDYGEAIDKYYKFPIQTMDTYSRLKDVLYALISTKSATNSVIKITYESDYRTRDDLTPISTYSYCLSPRSLRLRNLKVVRYANVIRRDIMEQSVRHFGLVLSNNTVDEDLSIVSVQLIYRFSGKER